MQDAQGLVVAARMIGEVMTFAAGMNASAV